MRKIILSSVFAIALIVIAGYGVNKSMNSYANLNELALKNVIALANIENPDPREEGGENSFWKGYQNNFQSCLIKETRRCDFEIWIPGYGYCKLGFDYPLKFDGTQNECLFTANMNNQCDYFRCRKNE